MSQMVFRLRSDPTQVRDILCRLRSTLPCSDVDLNSFEIVTAEILNNICEHAYGGRDDGHINLAIQRANDALVFEVSDSGKPMPGGVLPASVAQSVAVDIAQLPEGGFGWFFIHSLTSYLSYERQNDRNILRYTIAPAV